MYIVAVSFIGGGNRSTLTEIHRLVTSRWQTLSHNLYRVHLAMSRIRTRNFIRDIALIA
jgi:hypothetical protein